jgi:hypothetical protein
MAGIDSDVVVPPPPSAWWHAAQVSANTVSKKRVLVATAVEVTNAPIDNGICCLLNDPPSLVGEQRQPVTRVVAGL